MSCCEITPLKTYQIDLVTTGYAVFDSNHGFKSCNRFVRLLRIFPTSCEALRFVEESVIKEVMAEDVNRNINFDKVSINAVEHANKILKDLRLSLEPKN